MIVGHDKFHISQSVIGEERRKAFQNGSAWEESTATPSTSLSLASRRVGAPATITLCVIDRCPLCTGPAGRPHDQCRRGEIDERVNFFLNRPIENQWPMRRATLGAWRQMATFRARNRCLHQLEECLSPVGHRLVLGFAFVVANPTKPQEATVVRLWTALRCGKPQSQPTIRNEPPTPPQGRHQCR